MQAIQAPLIMLMVLGAIVFAIHAGGPGSPQAQEAYENKEQQTRQIVYRGMDWCCPPDPSSRSILQDRAMQAWAGDEEPLVATFGPWFPEQDTTEFAVKASWAARDGPATHTVDLYRSAPAEGKTAGSQQLAKPAHQGPAFVVPRLDKVAPTSSADVLALPVHNLWPYHVGPRGAHADHIETEIVYQRTSPGDSGTYEAEMTGHTEVTGAARPATDMHFAEPDWERLEARNERLGLTVSVGDSTRTFTQALTKEDLSAERSLHTSDAFNDSEDLDSGAYPHHPFQVNVNLSGPGAIDAGARNATDGNTTQFDEAYKLKVHVPRNWTEVTITPEPGDADDNKENNWTRTSVEELPSGGHRITSFLNVTAEFSVSGTRHVDRPRWVLTNGTEINAPFRFHARPPSDTESTELGFQDIEATLEAMRFNARETADLTVEVASSPGRVHRSLDVHAPSLVPETPWAAGDPPTPEGIRLPIGATLKNGGESTEVDRITWTIPQATWTDEDRNPLRRIEPLEDFTGGEGRWSYSQANGTLTVRWQPDLTLTPTERTCDGLEACAVAASLVLDGRGLNQRPLWGEPKLVSLYETDDSRDYVDWFVRSLDAWEGVPVEHDQRPGFALGHRYPIAEAGPAEGAYRFTVPPTLTPACEEQLRERNQADRSRRGDTVHYDFGPREDGLPHLAPLCEQRSRQFLAVAEMGDRYHTDAIGNRAYESVADLSGQTVAKWHNGLAESSVSGPSETPAGSPANFSVQMDSLLDQLVHDGVGNATLEAEIYDPSNAWENHPWYHEVLREHAGLATDPNIDTTDEKIDRTFEDPEEPDCQHSQHRHECERADTGKPIPSSFNLSTPIPEDTVPGTHLLVLEVSWGFTTAGGTEITETGRLIEPFDVLPPQGGRVQGTALGMTAWDTDWR
ncbi:hypothetical protein BRD56_02675 [Thermoplasmatales archaeon SW_10_69_26]|nr:MAG: hypothetical protein BRD56_02675 [Thermoplasmatales archaeon SW_10_69_26]